VVIVFLFGGQPYTLIHNFYENNIQVVYFLLQCQQLSWLPWWTTSVMQLMAGKPLIYSLTRQERHKEGIFQ